MTKRRNSNTSNIILLILSIASVIAVIIVFLFYSEHQNKLKTHGPLNTTVVSTSTPETTDKPQVEVAVDVIVPTEKTIGTRFNPPSGYKRIDLVTSSFGEYLRSFNLKEYNAKPLSYNTTTDALEENEALSAVSVLDISLINSRNLQIAPNSIIRLYAEYLYKHARYDDISFKLATTPAFECDYATWTKGGRLKVNENGTKIEWCLEHGAHCTHRDVELGASQSTFKYYLQNVMMYTSTASFKTNLYKIQNNDIAPGDVIFYADSSIPSIVVDVAADASGNKIFILAQGGTPASEIYIMRNEKNSNNNPWYSLAELPVGAEVYRF